MTSHNGYAACKVRVAMDDAIYSDLPKREGSMVRLCFYYRGYLVWQEARREWAFSRGECQADERGHRYYRTTGDGRAEPMPTCSTHAAKLLRPLTAALPAATADCSDFHTTPQRRHDDERDGKQVEQDPARRPCGDCCRTGDGLVGFCRSAQRC